MKAIMLSIQPQHCNNICTVIGESDGKPVYKKTIEVRKTSPTVDMPFKCYIYCTASNVHSCLVVGGGEVELFHCCNYKTAFVGGGVIGNGKVIGEFVCDRIDEYSYNTIDGLDIDDDELLETMLDREEIDIYANGKDLYGLHITDLKIYDKPKELGEFRRVCKQYGSDNPFCDNCKYYIDERTYEYDKSDCAFDGHPPLTRPPQSWCYVEEI